MEPTQAVLETSSKTIRSENISEVRIHVERAIQRIKTFHILDGEEKLPMKVCIICDSSLYHDALNKAVH
jgi:hypothetical protein